MKTKLVKADFNPDTGISQAIIRNKYGTFLGIAQCHPEEDRISSFTGCRYAEARAHINCVNTQIVNINSKLKALSDLEKVFSQKKYTNYDSPEWETLRKIIYQLKKEKNDLVERRNSMKAALKKSMDVRDEYFEKLAKKGE